MISHKRIGVIADGDPYYRSAVAAILLTHFHLSEVIEVSSLDEAIECLSDIEQVEVAVLDQSMPGMQQLTNLTVLREQFPNVRLAVVAGSSTRGDILSAIDAGVHGYILKSLSGADLVKAMSTILEGGIYVPPSLADVRSIPSLQPSQAAMQRRRQTIDQPRLYGDLLTPRQREVLDLLVQGKSNKQIARALRLGEGTVKSHMNGIFRQFGVNSRTAAAVAGSRSIPGRSTPPRAN